MNTKIEFLLNESIENIENYYPLKKDIISKPFSFTNMNINEMKETLLKLMKIYHVSSDVYSLCHSVYRNLHLLIDFSHN